MTAWEDIRTDVESHNLKGKEIIIKNVRAQKHKKRGTVRIFVDDIIKAEQIDTANKYGLDPRQIHQLLLLHTDLSFYKSGYIETTYRFYKMLFEHREMMRMGGYGRSYNHFRFVPARAGPLPPQFKPLMKNLAERGFVDVKWIEKPGMKKSSIFKLTKKGEEITKDLWDRVPLDVKIIFRKSKTKVLFSDMKQLRDSIHKEYPEFKRDFVSKKKYKKKKSNKK